MADLYQLAFYDDGFSRVILHDLDPSTQTHNGVTDVFPLPGTDMWARGLAHDGTDFWISEPVQNKIEKVSMDGTLLESYPADVDRTWDTLRGMTFHQDFLWVISGGALIQVDPATGLPTGTSQWLPPDAMNYWDVASDGTNFYLTYQDEFGTTQVGQWQPGGGAWGAVTGASLAGDTGSVVGGAQGLDFFDGHLWIYGQFDHLLLQVDWDGKVTVWAQTGVGAAGDNRFGWVWVGEAGGGEPGNDPIDTKATRRLGRPDGFRGWSHTGGNVGLSQTVPRGWR